MFHRDSASLQMRYKQVMYQIRIYAKWEVQNAMATGGGPSVPKPKEIKIEVTGPLLEVKQHFGKLITGLQPFDSDYRQQVSVQQPLNIAYDEVPSSLVPAIDSTATEVENIANDEVPSTLVQAMDPTASAMPNELSPSHSSASTLLADFEPIERRLWTNARSETVTSGVDGESTVRRSILDENTFATTVPKTAAINTTNAISQAPTSSQFFPTTEQRRRRGRIINSQMSSERQQFIEEERERARELHELKKAALRSENERRLADMRELNEIKILEIRRRNQLRELIYGKQEKFWDSMIAMGQSAFARPSQATQVGEPHASEAFQSRSQNFINIEVLQNASDLGEETEQHVEDLASAANVDDSEDSIQSNYDDPYDLDYINDSDLYDEE